MTIEAIEGRIMRRWSSEDEAKLRRHAHCRGFVVMSTRGREEQRRKKAGMGTYMLIDTTTNSVPLFAAELADIARFLKAHKRQQQRHLH
jgi:hypothetical protein